MEGLQVAPDNLNNAIRAFDEQAEQYEQDFQTLEEFADFPLYVDETGHLAGRPGTSITKVLSGYFLGSVTSLIGKSVTAVTSTYDNTFGDGTMNRKGVISRIETIADGLQEHTTKLCDLTENLEEISISDLIKVQEVVQDRFNRLEKLSTLIEKQPLWSSWHKVVHLPVQEALNNIQYFLAAKSPEVYNRFKDREEITPLDPKQFIWRPLRKMTDDECYEIASFVRNKRAISTEHYVESSPEDPLVKKVQVLIANFEPVFQQFFAKKLPENIVARRLTSMKYDIEAQKLSPIWRVWATCIYDLCANEHSLGPDTEGLGKYPVVAAAIEMDFNSDTREISKPFIHHWMGPKDSLIKYRNAKE